MNFGAFAGGFSQGLEQGMRNGKNLRELIKEGKLQDLREQGMAEAEAQRAKSVQDMVKEGGVTGETPTSGPVSTETPKVETTKVETPADAQAVSEASPTASPDAAQAKGAASAMAPQQVTAPAEAPTANPDAAAAATAAGNMPKGSQLPLSTPTVVGKPNGMIEQGNIDLSKRPVVKNADGSISTVRSMSVNFDGKEVLIPTVVGGKVVTDAEAIDHFKKTGEHLGVFTSPEAATTYADNLHNQQAKDYAQPASPQQSVAATGLTQKQSGKFSVNGQSYDTREQALAAAEKAAPSANDLFMKNAVPKLAAQYVVNGEPEKAKAWTDYADSVNGKRAIKDWAAAYTAPDFDTAATRFGKYYTEHINDGVDYTGHKMLTKEDGTQVAVVTLKDKATGKSIEMEMTREKMLAMGAANNPQKLFETEQAKQAATEKMKFEVGLKAQERKATREDQFTLEKYKQDRLDSREGLKSDREVTRENAKVNAKIDAQVSSLRDAGYSDADIKKMMPAIVGAGDHKKTTDPTERRALVASDLLKNDPSFARKPKDEQNKRIDDMMGVIYGDAAKAEPTKPAAPVIVDKPMAYDKNLPVKYRKSDGKAFHVNAKGEYIPIEGAVPTQPAAGGLPQQK